MIALLEVKGLKAANAILKEQNKLHIERFKESQGVNKLQVQRVDLFEEAYLDEKPKKYKWGVAGLLIGFVVAIAATL